MTTTPDEIDRMLLQLVDQALERVDGGNAEAWLLDRIPADQHSRARKLFAMAKAITGEHSIVAFDSGLPDTIIDLPN